MGRGLFIECPTKLPQSLALVWVATCKHYCNLGVILNCSSSSTMYCHVPSKPVHIDFGNHAVACNVNCRFYAYAYFHHGPDIFTRPSTATNKGGMVPNHAKRDYLMSPRVSPGAGFSQSNGDDEHVLAPQTVESHESFAHPGNLEQTPAAKWDFVKTLSEYKRANVAKCEDDTLEYFAAISSLTSNVPRRNNAQLLSASLCHPSSAQSFLGTRANNMQGTHLRPTYTSFSQSPHADLWPGCGPITLER